MKKIIFYIAAIIFTVFYGYMAAILGIGSISSIVLIWLALFLVSGILLSKNMFWGGLLGMLPAIHLIYMGMQETGQIISEMSIGVIVLLYYSICTYYVYKKKGSNRSS